MTPDPFEPLTRAAQTAQNALNILHPDWQDSPDRDAILTDLVADLTLHRAMLDNIDVDPNASVFEAVERAVRFLAHTDLDDRPTVEQLHTLMLGVTLLGEDPEAIREGGERHALADGAGDGFTRPLESGLSR